MTKAVARNLFVQAFVVEPLQRRTVILVIPKLRLTWASRPPLPEASKLKAGGVSILSTTAHCARQMRPPGTEAACSGHRRLQVAGPARAAIRLLHSLRARYVSASASQPLRVSHQLSASVSPPLQFSRQSPRRASHNISHRVSHFAHSPHSSLQRARGQKLQRGANRNGRGIASTKGPRNGSRLPRPPYPCPASIQNRGRRALHTRASCAD